jgi:chemotaxis protein CheD
VRLQPSEQRASHEYFDHEFACTTIKVLPGEYHVDNGDRAIVTVLGSCVAACIRDRQIRIGGMNHFMLPDAGQSHADDSSSMRYGACAMEVLINELLKMGADRRRLEAKIFGGGSVIAGAKHLNVGARNAAFVKKYLALERIPVLGADLGETWGRKVVYFPANGRVMVRKVLMSDASTDARAESAYARHVERTPPSAGGDIELFA